jgi:hypothetical protein
MVLMALAGVALSPVARADIYTWTDANGRVNISNLAPPDGVKVTSVVRETPKPVLPMQFAATAAPQPDVQVLNDRVRQLELEVELARRQAPAAAPTIIYANAPAPQPPAQYSYGPDPAPNYGYGYGYGGYGYGGYGCDPSWFGCSFGYAPYWYGPGIIVVRTPAFHGRDFGRGRYPTVNPLPGRGGPGQGRPPGQGGRPPGGMGMSASFSRR